LPTTLPKGKPSDFTLTFQHAGSVVVPFDLPASVAVCGSGVDGLLWYRHRLRRLALERENRHTVRIIINAVNTRLPDAIPLIRGQRDTLVIENQSPQPITVAGGVIAPAQSYANTTAVLAN
jgi:hypothetical protein